MKRASLVLTVLILVTFLVACGPRVSPETDSPEKAAKEWTEAFLNLDGNTMIKRTCSAQQENVQEGGAWLSFAQVFAGQRVEADISDLHFETVSKNGNSARVRVYGEIRIAVLGMAQATQVDTTYTMIQEGGRWKWCGEEEKIGSVQTAAPTPATQPAGRWEIIPTVVIGSPGEGGWQYVMIVFALENRTGQFSTPYIVTANSSLTTEEGYSYPAEAQESISDETEGHSQPTNVITFHGVLPPGIRPWEEIYDGKYHGFYTFHSRIAQNTHPQKLTIPGYGDINLKGVPFRTSMDGSYYWGTLGGLTYSPIRKAGETVEIPGKARLTVLGFTRETWPEGYYYPIDVEVLRVLLRLENLSAGYETSLNISFTAFGLESSEIGDFGILGSPLEGALGSLECQPVLTMGPAQTIETNLCVIIPKGLENVRLILAGDVNEVYDTG